jgi:hypothetical protein
MTTERKIQAARLPTPEIADRGAVEPEAGVITADFPFYS